MRRSEPPSGQLAPADARQKLAPLLQRAFPVSHNGPFGGILRDIDVADQRLKS